MLDDLVPAGDGLAFVDSDTVARLGASALMAAALAQRRDATGDARYDDELRALGRFMAGQITTGGQMLVTYDLQAGAPVPGETSRYATGEAAWAFAQLHNLFPDEGWDVPARRVLDYLATGATRSKTSTTGRGPTSGPPTRWPSWRRRAGRAPHHVRPRAGRALRDARAHRVPEGQLAGGLRRPPRPRRRSGRVGRGPGIAVRRRRAASRLADLREPLADASACGAGILVERQQDASDAAEWPSPDLVEGAWFRDDVTRMDDQQHALSGLLAAAGQGPGGPVRP